MTLSMDARALILEQIQQELADGTLTLGGAVRRLRTDIAKLRQDQLAKACKISVRTLINLEQDEGNPTLKSLNAVFKPFGLHMGVVPYKRHR